MDAQTLEIAKANLALVASGRRPEEIEAQEAIVRDLEAKLRYYQENIALSQLVSPISGQIVTPYLEHKMGRIMEKGELFAVLQDASKIRAEILIPESDIGEVSAGARVKIKLWAYPMKYFYSNVVYIAPVAENMVEGRIVRVLSEFENDENMFKPDMTGEAKIRGEWKPVIIAFTRWIIRFFVVEVWSWFP
jgi:multidrug efflux pump subunit AcrA (membrane-fusion protein)